MAAEVREYLRAAQAAEVRGDKARAIHFLQKAAKLYEDAGNQPRAEQMLRQIGRLRAVPEQQKESGIGGDAEQEALAAGAGSGGQAAPEALSGLMSQMSSGARSERQRRPRPELFQRGPALADPGLDAWCSFCCRPRNEVGALIAGPAGAYVCGACAKEALQLLGAQERRPDRGAKRGKRSKRRRSK